MIKRPLVLITVAFLLGIILAEQIGKNAICVPVFLIVLILIITRKRKKDIFVMVFPLFILIGEVRCYSEIVLSPMEQMTIVKSECIAIGKITQAVCADGYAKMYLQTEAIISDEKVNIKDEILIYTTEEELCAPGSYVEIRGQYNPLSIAMNPGEFDEKSFYRAQGVHGKIYADAVTVHKRSDGLREALWALKCRMRDVYRKVLPDKEAGILAAMMLAEKGMIDNEVKKNYQDSGISHILAISGLHLSQLGLGVYALLRKCKRGVNASTAASIFVMLLFGLFVGTGVSVLRALLMFILSVSAKWAGKTYDTPTALAFSALVVLWREPLQLFQAGFLLSFGAVIGIVILVPIFQKMKWNLMASGLAVQLLLIPVMLWFYYELPIYSLLLNLIVLPCMGLLLVLALVIGIVGSIWIGGGFFFAGGAHFLLVMYDKVCEISAGLPYHKLVLGRPTVWQIIFYYLILFLFVFLGYRKKGRKVLLLLGILPFILFFRNSNKTAVTFLAVGQGDCAVLQKGRLTMLFDAGGSIKKGTEKILNAFLKYQGDVKVEYAFVSHADRDHIFMLEEVLDLMATGKSDIMIENLIMPIAGSKGEGYQRLTGKAQKAGVNVITFRQNDQLSFDGLDIVCVLPEGESKKKEKMTNENSMVLAVISEAVEYIFTGDLPMEEEQALTDYVRWLETEKQRKQRILKVAHHGSKYSTGDDFLSCFRPDYAIISCGEGNSYGHPHRELLERLEEYDIDIRITKDVGAITIREDGGNIVFVDNVVGK